MNRSIVILAPTEAEAKPLRKISGGHAVRICGVGAVETAAAVARLLSSRRLDVVVLAGIAGSYGSVGVGHSVLVESETTADTGSWRAEGFQNIFSRTYHCPYATRVSQFPLVNSNSVNVAGGPFVSRDADIENMEGAAFFAMCEVFGVAFLELRTVSNLVGDAREKWNMELALENLARDVKILLDEIEG